MKILQVSSVFSGGFLKNVKIEISSDTTFFYPGNKPPVFCCSAVIRHKQTNKQTDNANINKDYAEHREII